MAGWKFRSGALFINPSRNVGLIAFYPSDVHFKYPTADEGKEALKGVSFTLKPSSLVVIVGISTLGSRLLTLGRSGLLGRRLGGDGLAHDLLLDVAEGDRRRVGVLETGHLGKLLVVNLDHKTVNHDLASVHDVAMEDDAAERLRDA